MKELIFLQIGQAGVQIGDQCWELFRHEHGLDEAGTVLDRTQIDNNYDGIQTLFYESIKEKFVPRCLFIDLDPSTIDQIRQGPNRYLFHCDTLISGKEDAAGNYARGSYTVGRDLLTTCEDKIRKLVEGCNNFQGFVFMNSIGGGTGSGFGSRFCDKLKLNYSKSNRVGFTIYPSPKLFTAITEPYNTVLAINSMLENSDAQFCIDNEALYSICENQLEVESPNYANVNQIIAQISAFMTASMRFKGELNKDLKEMINNLVIYPKMQFLIQSYAPFSIPYTRPREPSLIELTNQVFHPNNMLVKCDPRKGKYLACELIYKGDIFSQELISDVSSSSLKDKINIEFVDSLKTNFHVGINWNQPKIKSWCNFPETPKSLYMCGNSSSIHHLFSKINLKFDKMLAKRAFNWWYVQEGMEEGEFSEARENIEILQKDYQKVENN